MADPQDLETRILAAIRRIVRAIDLHSRRLVRQHRITSPQLVALREIARLGPISVSALARAVNLSQPTVTGILARLERQGLVLRERGGDDRRTVVSTVTPAGRDVLEAMPPLLQDTFLRQLALLEEWEQTQILATLQRIAGMMDAERIAADPVLATEPLPSDEELQRTGALPEQGPPAEAGGGRRRPS